jgi:hypothetical protein
MRSVTSLAERSSSLGLAIGSVLLSLVIAEAAMRVFGRNGRNTAANVMADLYVASSDERIVYEHAPLARVTFPESISAAGSNPAWRVSTNQEGLRRNTEEAGADPELRGICLGDSIMGNVPEVVEVGK